MIGKLIGEVDRYTYNRSAVNDIFKTLSYAPHKTYEIWVDLTEKVVVLIIRHFSNLGLHWESNYFHFPNKKSAEDALLLVKLST
jgi:hypothetical protein